MPSESLSTPSGWHADLNERDHRVRSAIGSRSAEAEIAALQQRLEGLMAELRISRSAVAVRDGILREQSGALRERQLEFDAAQSLVGSMRTSLETVQATISWRILHRAARVLRAPRRLARR